MGINSDDRGRHRSEEETRSVTTALTTAGEDVTRVNMSAMSKRVPRPLNSGVLEEIPHKKTKDMDEGDSPD